jgi:hypothetical protein
MLCILANQVCINACMHACMHAWDINIIFLGSKKQEKCSFNDSYNDDTSKSF